MKDRMKAFGEKVKNKVKDVIEYNQDSSNHFVDIIHIGTKLLFLNKQFPVVGAPFYPIFDENNKIIGT